MLKTLDLNGAWTLRQLSNGQLHPATVPGCVHADLLAAGAIPDPFYGTNEYALQWIEEEDWEYSRDFLVNASLLNQTQVDLFCEGLDTVATVFINDVEVGNAANMFHPHRFAMRHALQEGNNSLRIIFTSPMKAIRALNDGPLVPISNDRVGGRTLLRKEQCSFGWDWGARFATSGIGGNIRIEGYSHDRPGDVRVSQDHSGNEVRVMVDCSDESALSKRVSLSVDGQSVAAITSDASQLELTVPDAQLWWPNGLGPQPLYTLTVEFLDAEGEVLEVLTRRIGLRELKLEQKPDEWGTTFQFVVNGVPVFAKGANWIPCHAFLPGRTPEMYRDLLTSSRDAHMNMIRVWGGGSYEKEIFYDLCDELGLLVWQDFMFACSMYPSTPEFLESVKREAAFNIRRLRHRACLALWCGNNEAEHMDPAVAAEGSESEGYRKTFYEMLPALVKQHNPGISYIPSSPFNPAGLGHKPNNDDSGDTHFWDVWHARKPVELYEQQKHRFFSEFGMQAYPHPETVATFTNDTNLFGPDMDCHQKNGGGNSTIFEYVSRLYRFPKDYRGSAMLSQLNQAYCMKVGIEHMRRNMPRTMGAIYWQLNDNWPVASWSSIDFGGRWRALHYAARRFYAPLLISVKRLGEESMHMSSNTLFSTIHGGEVVANYDGHEPVGATYSWALFDCKSGEVVSSGGREIQLQPNTATALETLDFTGELEIHGRASLVLKTSLCAEGLPESVNTTFFAAPKKIEFHPNPVEVAVQETAGGFTLNLKAVHFTPSVMFYLADGTDLRASDNFVDLFPGDERTVTARPMRTISIDDFRAQLRIESLTDWYA